MLKRANRLKSKRAFCATYNNNSCFINDCFVLYLGKLKIDESCPTRVGFVVSKKVSKSAVKRNRLKRLMRESVRLIFKNSTFDDINKFQSLIFIARSNALDMNYIQISNAILTLVQKTATKNI